jgi:hypothetical protein
MPMFLQRLFRTCSAGAPPAPRTRSSFLTVELLEQRQLLSVTYHGGPLIPNIEVDAIYYGQAWANYPTLRQQIDTYLRYLPQSCYMALLAEYSVGPYHIGAGRLETSLSFADPLPATVTESLIYRRLVTAILGGQLAGSDGNRVYFVLTPPNFTVQTQNGGVSGKDFFAYHTYFASPLPGPVAQSYCVILPWIANSANPFDTLTEAAGHELVEVVTDPYANGWTDPTKTPENGEIADLALSTTTWLNGYFVQGVWSNRFNGPVLPTTLYASLLTHSAEFYTDEVAQAYQKFLGRPADALGLQTWVNLLIQGLTDEQLEAEFLGSPEYSVHVGGTDVAWLEAVYRDLLGRPADAFGQGAWLQVLAGGASRTAVALAFAGSLERLGQVVRNDYAQALGRPAAAADVEAWVAVLQQGESRENVLAEIVGSPEFVGARNYKTAPWLTDAYRVVLHRAIDNAGLVLGEQYFNRGL